MNNSGMITARVEFLAATHNDQGEVTHRAGEVMQGSLLSRTGDFLLVRTTSGTCVYVDASRHDLYCVDLLEAGTEMSEPVVRIRDTGVTNLVVQRGA